MGSEHLRTWNPNQLNVASAAGYTFPRIKELDEQSINSQLNRITDELNEAEKAPKRLDRALECMDIMQVVEGVLRLDGWTDAEVARLRAMTIERNDLRGYYGAPAAHVVQPAARTVSLAGSMPENVR